MNSGLQPAPVALFAYKRPDELRQTLAALQANHLASQTSVYVFVDGPKQAADRPKVEAVRALVDRLDGFGTVHRQYADRNCGLATSIITGVSQVIAAHGRVIVLEDDLVTTPNFLDYMNQCLRDYQRETRVFSVSAYSFPFARPDQYRYDGYLLQRPNSWGWATWADRWEKADWAVSDYGSFRRDATARKRFAQGGSDLVQMLHKQQHNIIDSWYIRWCYSQYKSTGLTVYPALSKIQNIGFGQEATNTNIYNRYKTTVDDGASRTFRLPDEIAPTPYYHRLNLHRYSLGVRLYNRLKTYLIRFRPKQSVTQPQHSTPVDGSVRTY